MRVLFESFEKLINVCVENLTDFTTLMKAPLPSTVEISDLSTRII